MSDVVDNAIRQNQTNGPPKERGETYWYRGSKKWWIKHTPGVNLPVRAYSVLYADGLRDGYSDGAPMNIGSEQDAYQLYKALEAYFSDRRSVPYWVVQRYPELVE